MRSIQRLLRTQISRGFFFVNTRSIQPHEQPVSLYSTDMYPIFLQARQENNETTTMQGRPEVAAYVEERLPYIVYSHFTANQVNVVLNMEFYKESKILKLTCLDPSTLIFI